MQTIYTTSYRLGVRDNVIDFNEYRRRLEQTVEQPEEELEVNPRSRSAKLRVCEKL